jgi:hypothetical protein
MEHEAEHQRGKQPKSRFPAYRRFTFENRCCAAIMEEMFESLEPRPELAKDWIIAAYLSNFVIGASGVLIAFWKYGTSHPLVLVC